MVYSLFFWCLLCGLAQQGLDFGFGQAEGLHLVQKLRRQRAGAPTAQGLQGAVSSAVTVRPAVRCACKRPRLSSSCKARCMVLG